MDENTLRHALDETCAPLESARGLPRAAYTEDELFARECSELFARSWLVLGRLEDAPEVGSYFTHEVVRERVLVVRGDDRQLRAFHNVCRHRGTRLIEQDQGQLQGAIVCPYHAWSYALDGGLRGAPKLQTTQGLAGTLDLSRLPLATWAGFVFVALDADVAPADEHLAGLSALEPFELAELLRVRRMEYTVGANWKIVCENYSECYHCAGAHPQLHRLADVSGGGFESGEHFNGGPMRLRPGFDTLSTSGRSPWSRLNSGADAEADLVLYYLVYPNLMLGIHPDYLVTHRVWPLSVDRARVVCELFYPRRTLADPTFDPADAAGFWDLTNRQDWALCERVQRGVESRGYLPGPYHPSERCVHAFDRWYAQWLITRLSRRGEWH
jgi:Rieske 2Fe-2S family protein